MRTKFKPWTIEFLNEHPEINLTLETLKEHKFSFPIYLEIGSGKGDFILKIAKKYPDITFIGVEKNITCAGITCKKLFESDIKNAFIISEDVEKVFHLLTNGAIEGIFLNFSDPWPKKRHEKRRLTSKSFLDRYYKLLKPDGNLFFKTDNKDFFDYSVKMFNLTKGWELILVDEDYDGKIDFDAESEYELSFRNLGQNIYRLVAKKENKNGIQ